MGSSRQEYWCELPFPSSGDLLIQGSNLGLLHCRQILYHPRLQGSPSSLCCHSLKRPVAFGRSGPEPCYLLRIQGAGPGLLACCPVRSRQLGSVRTRAALEGGCRGRGIVSCPEGPWASLGQPRCSPPSAALAWAVSLLDGAGHSSLRGLQSGWALRVSMPQSHGPPFRFLSTNSFFFFFLNFYLFWLHRVACRIAVPPPGTEPGHGSERLDPRELPIPFSYLSSRCPRSFLRQVLFRMYIYPQEREHQRFNSRFFFTDIE